MKKANDFSNIFKALGDFNRLTIAILLFKRELCVCEIVNVLPISFSTVSSHLKVLQNAGIVESRKEGKWIVYRLSNNKFIVNIVSSVFNELKSEPFVLDLFRKVDTCNRNICSLNSNRG